MQKLFIYLKPLKNRIHLKRAVWTMLIALTVALFSDTVFMLYSKFAYVYDIYTVMLTTMVVILSIAIVISFAICPSIYKTARVADSLGYDERFVTAYEVLKKESITDMEELVLRDAEKCAKTIDLKNSYSIAPNKQLAFAPFIALLLLAMVYLLPIEPTQRMEELEQMHEQLDTAVEDIQKQIDTSNLTATQQKQIGKELKALKKELSKTNNKTDAVNSIMNTQTKLKKVVANSENKQISALGDKLSQNSATQEIGELLKNGNIEQFNEALNTLTDNLGNMDSQQLKALGDALNEAAQSGEINAETKQLLNELGDTLQKELTDEQLTQVAQNLQELNDTINELAQQNQDMREAVEQVNQALAGASEDLSGTSNMNSQSGNTGESQGTAQGQGEAQGQAQGQGETQSGQAQGEGQAVGQSGGTGRGTGSISGANVYTANAQQYSDYDVELNQSNSEGTGDEVKTKVNGETGEIVPYENVFDEYKNDAMSSIEQDNVPYGVQSIVKDYFSSLE